MSLNSFGAVFGIVALVAILFLYGHEHAKHATPAPRAVPQVSTPAPTPPLPVKKPNIIARIFHPAPAPKVAPSKAAPKAPVSIKPTGTIKVYPIKPDGSLDLTKPKMCVAVEPFTKGMTIAQIADKAKSLGTTPAVLANGVRCLN